VQPACSPYDSQESVAFLPAPYVPTAGARMETADSWNDSRIVNKYWSAAGLPSVSAMSPRRMAAWIACAAAACWPRKPST